MIHVATFAAVGADIVAQLAQTGQAERVEGILALLELEYGGEQAIVRVEEDESYLRIAKWLRDEVVKRQQSAQLANATRPQFKAWTLVQAWPDGAGWRLMLVRNEFVGVAQPSRLQPRRSS